MAIDFPQSPATGDQFTAGATTYEYDGEKWISTGTSPNTRLSRGANTLEINSGNELIWTGGTAKFGETFEVGTYDSSGPSTTEGVRLTTTGFIGISATDDSSSSTQFRIKNSSGTHAVEFFSDGSATFADELTIGSGSINVQISPNTGLEINDGAINSYQATTNVNATPFKIRSDVGGTGVEKLSIKADGDIVIGGTDVATGLQGIKMYLGSNDPSIVGCKADNNPGSLVTLLKLAGYSQSGANFRENAAILFETDAANNAGSASGRIVFRTEDSGFVNGPLTRMAIDNAGVVKYYGATGESEGVAGLIVCKRANVSNNSTLDIAIPSTSFGGHLYVSSVLLSNAAARTNKIFFVASRLGNSTAITEMNADNGGSGGRSFTITDQSSGSGNVLRFRNTSGAEVNVALFYVGAGGF